MVMSTSFSNKLIKVPQLASDPSGGVSGDMYYNTTSNKMRTHNGTSWQDVVATADDALLVKEIATPSTPASGYAKAYPKADGLWYGLDDTGAERKLGSGGGLDQFYTQDFESGSYSDFTASGTFTIANGARSSTAVLNGAKEAKFTRGSANDTISWSVVIPAGYCPSIIRGSFVYETGSSYVDNDIEIEVFNGATELSVINHQLKAGKSKHPFEFQTDAATADTTYTFKFKQATTGSWTDVYIDDLVISSREIARGSVVTDWETVTMTLTGVTTSSLTSKRRRIGDSYEYRMWATLSGTPSGTIYANLPSGNVIDTGKTQRASYPEGLGQAVCYDASTSTRYVGTVSADASDTTRVVMRGAGGAVWNATVPVSWVNTDELTVSFLVPIVGLSSNTTMSTDFGGRVIAYSARNGGASTTTIGTGWTQITNLTMQYDTVGGAGSNQYTIQESGYYLVETSVRSPGVGASRQIDLGIDINGSSQVQIAQWNNLVASSQAMGMSGSKVQYFTRGDVVKMVAKTSASTDAVGDYTPTHFSIMKIQSPQTLMGGEVVVLRAVKSSGSHTSTGNWVGVASYDTEVFDSHGSFNPTTGIYTFAQAGKYLLSASVGFVSNVTGTRGVRIDTTAGAVS
jgi:hypothetical protein